MAHQYIDQLSDTVASAVFGNVGSIVAFRVAGGDAERLARELGRFVPAVYRDLARGQVCARVLAGGETVDPFLGETVPDATPIFDRAASIREQSRQRYAYPHDLVKSQISHWLRD